MTQPMTQKNLTILIPAVLAIAVLAASTPVFAQPQFINATSSADLDFELDYGTYFDEVENQPENIRVLWRNMGNGVAVGDFDNDGDLDIYLLAQLGNENKLFLNNVIGLGTKTFTDVTAAPLNNTGMSRVAHFADLNNDGWLDLLLLNDDQRNEDETPSDTSDDTSDHSTSKIFRNNGDGTWTDVTAGSGFDESNVTGYLRGGCSLADYDGDGKVDVYLSVWTGQGLVLEGDPHLFPGTNQLFKNMGDFKFTDVTSDLDLAGFDFDSFTSIFTDLTDDQAPDIYVAVDHAKDAYYTNDVVMGGTGKFLDIDESTVGLGHVGNDMGVAVADIDDDDDLDLYATNIKDPGNFWGNPPQANALHINQSDLGGGLDFVDEAATRGIDGTRWGWGTVFVDVENDSDLDLLAVNGFDEFANKLETQFNRLPCDVCDSPAYLFINDGAGNFARDTSTGLDTTFNLGWDSRGLVAFDYDRDGDQDFIVTNVNEAAVLVENITGEVAKSAVSNHYLTVQPEPYHLAVGARVYATVGAKEKRRDLIPARSYMSGFPMEAHFGLGVNAQTDLRVVWADGCETALPATAANQVLKVQYFDLDFLNAGNLTFEEDQAVPLSANATDCSGVNRNSDIEWSEGTIGNVVGTGGSFDASGRSAGSYPFFVTFRDPSGFFISEPFTLEILAAAPPVRSAAAPSGEVPVGSTMATLTLNTDEDASCRLGTSAGISYTSMITSFDSTGGTSHSTPVTGLVENTSYSYYVRCQDDFLHANIDDLTIHFIVPEGLFIDGFESGTTSEWSSSVP